MGSCPTVGHATQVLHSCTAETDQRFRSSQTTFRIHRKIPRHIGESFGQSTDRRWKPADIWRERGNESTSRVTKKSPVSGSYQDLADMFSGFIAYLRRSDRRVAGDGPEIRMCR